MNQAKALSALLLALGAGSTYAQVFVNEQFNYADQAALNLNWQQGAGLTLSPTGGDPGAGAINAGTGTGANVWIGSTFSLIPTDENNVRLSADIFSSGNANQATTIGLRGPGAAVNPLFEMGMYRSFDNIQTGPDSSTTTAVTDGIGVRTLSIGVDLPGQDWVKMSSNYTGWAHFEATFSRSNVTTRIDIDKDGIWDFSYTEVGTNSIATIGHLRVHSPATSTGGPATVDNIVLEVVAVPEPTTYAMFGLGAGILWAARRRRK